jgi:hypothetical protein
MFVRLTDKTLAVPIYVDPEVNGGVALLTVPDGGGTGVMFKSGLKIHAAEKIGEVKEMFEPPGKAAKDGS